MVWFILHPAKVNTFFPLSLSHIRFPSFCYTLISNSVQNLEQDGETWAADVYGMNNYLTEVTIKNGQVTEWFCDCPYDHGPICKHVVAVLFAIRDETPDELITVTEGINTDTNKIINTK